MKAIFATLILTSATLLSTSAFAGSPFGKSPARQAQDRRPACSALPADTQVYSICHQECQATHSSGGGISNTTCEPDCLSRYCK